MNTVIFMRHGKAADAMQYADDFERPLEHRGRLEVFEAATNLLHFGIKPDLILASPACRTAVTARICAETFHIDPEEIIYQAGLYMSSRKNYLEAANYSKNKTTFIVGHNPFVGELSMHFSDSKIYSFPTSSIAAFGFSDTEISLKSQAEMLYFNLRK